MTASQPHLQWCTQRNHSDMNVLKLHEEDLNINSKSKYQIGHHNFLSTYLILTAKYFKCVLLTVPKYCHITASEPSKGFLKKKNVWSYRGQNPDVNCTLGWALFFKIHVQWIFTFFKGHATHENLSRFSIFFGDVLFSNNQDHNPDSACKIWWWLATFMQFMKSVNPINASDSLYSPSVLSYLFTREHETFSINGTLRPFVGNSILYMQSQVCDYLYWIRFTNWQKHTIVDNTKWR